MMSMMSMMSCLGSSDDGSSNKDKIRTLKHLSRKVTSNTNVVGSLSMLRPLNQQTDNDDEIYDVQNVYINVTGEDSGKTSSSSPSSSLSYHLYY